MPWPGCADEHAVRFLPDARAEFDAAVDWYDQKKAGLGPTFVARVREVLQRVSANPRLHSVVYKDVRKAVIKQFPFIVLYREESGEISVIAVFHTARDPSTWQSRA